MAYDPNRKISLEGITRCLADNPRLDLVREEALEIQREMEENERRAIERSVDPRYRWWRL